MRSYVWICLALIGGIFFIHMFYQSDVFSSRPLESDEEEQAVAAIAAILHKNRGQELWPGYTLDGYPIVLSFDSGHIYAFQLNSSSKRWEHREIGGEPVLFSSSDHWGIQRIQLRRDFFLEGQNALVFHWDKVEREPLEPIIALLHEHFYLHQAASFGPLEGIYRAHSDPINIAWMQVEKMVLADFIDALLDHNKSSTHKMSYLFNFLAICDERRARLDQSSIIAERDRQRIEGAAYFVASRALMALDIDGAKMIFGRLQAVSLNDEVVSQAVSSHHAIVGAALGYALNFLGIPEWRERVKGETTSSWDILKENLSLGAEERATRVRKVKSRYGFDGVVAQMTQAAQEYQEELEELIGEYNALDGVEVSIELDEDVVDNREGSLFDTFYLQDGRALSIAETVTIKLEDGSWQFHLLCMPVFIREGKKRFLFKIDENALCSIDDKNYSIAELLRFDGQEFLFRSLLLRSHHCSLQSRERVGRISVRDNRIYFIYAKSLTP